MRFRIFPIVLIALGSGLLLTKLGVLPGEEVRLLLHTWWPALLIALGAAMLLSPRKACGHWRERHCARPDPEANAKAG